MEFEDYMTQAQAALLSAVLSAPEDVNMDKINVALVAVRRATPHEFNPKKDGRCSYCKERPTTHI